MYKQAILNNLIKSAKTYNYSYNYNPNVSSKRSGILGGLMGAGAGALSTLVNAGTTKGLQDTDSVALFGVPWAASHVANSALGGLGSAAIAKKLGLSKKWQNRIGGVGMIANPILQQLASAGDDVSGIAFTGLLNAALGGMAGWDAASQNATNYYNNRYNSRF